MVKWESEKSKTLQDNSCEAEELYNADKSIIIVNK